MSGKDERPAKKWTFFDFDDLFATWFPVDEEQSIVQREFQRGLDMHSMVVREFTGISQRSVIELPLCCPRCGGGNLLLRREYSNYELNITCFTHMCMDCEYIIRTTIEGV